MGSKFFLFYNISCIVELNIHVVFSIHIDQVWGIRVYKKTYFTLHYPLLFKIHRENIFLIHYTRGIKILGGLTAIFNHTGDLLFSLGMLYDLMGFDLL